MIEKRIITAKNEWENFLVKQTDANFLHSWEWGEFHKNLGKNIFRYGFYENKKLIGVMLLIVEEARRGKYLTVPGGPAIDWENKKLVTIVFGCMREAAKESECSFVRVRPQLVDGQFSRNIFKKNGAVLSPMYLHAELTSQLDITKSEDKLLSDMRKNTRYEIRKAEKQGVRITTSKNINDIKGFYDLQMETAKRQKFIPFSYDFFEKQFKIFFETDNALLYTAKLEDKVLAEAFIIFYGKEAVYHYGASTEEGRKYPGAYLIQWEAIKDAKRRGMARYNFWGVAPEADADHRFSCLSLFKRGFGGEDVQYLPAHDLVISPLKYFLNFVIETVRRRIRNV